MSKKTEPRTVQAVQTTLDIIEYLQETERAGVTEIANELGHSKGTVHSHLTTLKQNEYLVSKNGEYSLSLRYIDFGETVKDRLGIYSVITDELNDLAADSGELAQFATEEHGKAVYLYKVRGENAIESASTIGRREYLHCISLGKAILSQFPDERVHEVLDMHGMHAYTQKTITDRADLFEELGAIRERGYAIDDGEKIRGLKCVSAPVLGSGDDVLGAVSVSAPSRRMTGERFEEELPQMVQRSANVIEINSKFS
ncbi:IclR family transcriptional regulator [Haladaptatus pallidirubidus]|uniref:IclR family transcriptional regulator n=1 Tax=Haladaptatus pallidirubidus TaxID=1008152 RepID=A0AAV3UPE7_9EURY|nr:IclR family transcriptional regulator [Haladaptatus pallidirubidus]